MMIDDDYGLVISVNSFIFDLHIKSDALVPDKLGKTRKDKVNILNIKNKSKRVGQRNPTNTMS